MPKKSYPAWQWLAATGLALVLGVTYSFVLFSPLLGPGMLVVAAYLGWRSWGAVKAERAADAIPAQP